MIAPSPFRGLPNEGAMTTEAPPMKKNKIGLLSDSDRIAEWISNRCRELGDERIARPDVEDRTLDDCILRWIQRDEKR